MGVGLGLELSLTISSRGEPHAKLGAWFTSSSHGRPRRSSMTSKPRISKHEKPGLSSPSWVRVRVRVRVRVGVRVGVRGRVRVRVRGSGSG